MIKILSKTRIVRIVSFLTSLPRSLDTRHYTSRPSFQMSAVESRMLDVGCQISDVRCRMSNLGCRMSDVECRMSDVRSRRSDVGLRMAPISFRRFLPQSELFNFRKIQLRFLAQKSELSMFQINNSYFCVINPCCLIGNSATRIFAL